jgi:hypothetical protein
MEDGAEGEAALETCRHVAYYDTVVCFNLKFDDKV